MRDITEIFKETKRQLLEVDLSDQDEKIVDMVDFLNGYGLEEGANGDHLIGEDDHDRRKFAELLGIDESKRRMIGVWVIFTEDAEDD